MEGTPQPPAAGPLRAQIAAARKRVTAAEDAAEKVAARLVRSQRVLAELEASGAPAARRREVRRRIEKLRTERGRRRAAVRDARTGVRRLREESLAAAGPEGLVGLLEGQVPAVLLPV